MSIKKRIRAIEALGWTVEITGRDHLRCRHPDAGRPVFAAATPSDKQRDWKNLMRHFNHALRDGAPKT